MSVPTAPQHKHSRKPHSLMPLLTDPARLKRAARACMRTASSAGADGVTWRAYRDGLDHRLARLASRLRDGTWTPGLVRPATLVFPDKRLPISIPTVEDRIVHRALRQVIEPIVERDAYQPWVYGWRWQHSRVDALLPAARRLTAGARWIADVDVAAATSGATVDEAIGWLARWIADGSLLTIVRRALEGLPSPLAPGGGLTPLLTNLRLVGADEQLTDLAVLRVTDNYAVFCHTQPEAQAAFSHVQAALTACRLAAHPTKSRVWRPNPEDLFLAG